MNETTEEEEEIQIPIDDEEETEKKEWCLLGKLWTRKSFNSKDHMDTMRKIWNPRQGMTSGDLGNNMFLFHFELKKDMQIILAMAP